MLLTNKILKTINNNERKYYLDLNYIIPKCKNPKIEIDIVDLKKNSNTLISCKCDICGKIKTISYFSYNKNIDNCGYYSCKGKCSRIKYSNTCLKLYGETNVFKNEDIKDKCKITMIEKYGVDNISKLESTKELHRQRNMSLFGVETYFESEEFKEKSKMKINEIYNVDNVFSSKLIQEKIKNYYIKNYNVEYPSQVENIHIKQQKQGFKSNYFKDLYYRGTYELDFIKKYYGIGIKNGKSLKYYFDNKYRIYFPDFFIEKFNLIVEIKSDYTYNKYIDMNKSKEEYTIKYGYKYIVIINKDYSEFESIVL